MNLGEILHQEKLELQHFWESFKNGAGSYEEKIDALKYIATIIYFKRTKSLKRYRKHFNENYKNMFNFKCFACGDPCQHRHHIIPLINGGINSRLNRIPLCRNCHVSIHPWMH